MAGERVRTFVAVDPSAATRAALVELKAVLATAGAAVRWVRDEALHCTLKFLGEVDSSRLDAIREAVEGAVAETAAFDVAARGTGVFPDSQRPRVVWAGFRAGQLAALAARVDEAAVALGFPREERAFAGHVTLGRVRGRRRWEPLRGLLEARAEDDLGITRVDHVVVYRSDLHRDGATYTPLWTIGLGGSNLLG